MARTTKQLIKAAAVLATTAVVKQVIRKAAEDPRVRRKAADLKQAVSKKARSAGKQARKQAVAVARDAGAKVEKRLASPRKAVGKKIKRLGKRVAG